jgi:hypothetical protein
MRSSIKNKVIVITGASSGFVEMTTGIVRMDFRPVGICACKIGAVPTMASGFLTIGRRPACPASYLCGIISLLK